MTPTRHFAGALLLLLAVVMGVFAQSDSSSVSPTPTSASSPPPSTTSAAVPTILPSTALYTYIGCYNETTGDAQAGNVRALAGGNMTASDSMTVAYCLNYCGSDAYAGLEYGRECWCAPYLNVNSAKLSDSNCSMQCSGDGKEVCGGSLTLTLYQHKNNTATGAAPGLAVGGVGYGLLGLGLLGVLL